MFGKLESRAEWPRKTQILSDSPAGIFNQLKRSSLQKKQEKIGGSQLNSGAVPPGSAARTPLTNEEICPIHPTKSTTLPKIRAIERSHFVSSAARNPPFFWLRWSELVEASAKKYLASCSAKKCNFRAHFWGCPAADFGQRCSNLAH